MKFTYKKHRPTGRYASFEAEHHDIKLKRNVVGTIHEIRTIGPKSHPDEGKFKISFMVNGSAKNNPNCSWRWVSINEVFESSNNAKQWIQHNLSKIQKLDLRQE